MVFSPVIGFTTSTFFERKRKRTQYWGEYKAAHFRGKWDLPDLSYVDRHMLVLWGTKRFLWSKLKHKLTEYHTVCIYIKQGVGVRSPSKCFDNLSSPYQSFVKWGDRVFFVFLSHLLNCTFVHLSSIYEVWYRMTEYKCCGFTPAGN